MPTATSEIQTENRPNGTAAAESSPGITPAARRAKPALGVVGESLLRLAAQECRSPHRPAKQPSRNRRALPRRIGMCRARVVLCPGEIPSGGPQRDWLIAGTPVSGELHNVTLRSAAFEISMDLAAGQRVLLRLENRDLGVRIDTVGDVVRTSPTGDAHLIVCELSPQLRYEDVAALGWMPFESGVV